MKHSQPQFTTVESTKDVQSMRDASGDVFVIGETIMQGIVNDTPTGRRRYANELLAYEAFLSMELGYAVDITARKVDAKIDKPIKPRAKRKAAKPQANKSTMITEMAAQIRTANKKTAKRKPLNKQVKK